MIISYNWLQSFFEEKLPAPEKVAEVLTMNAFEVESFEKNDDDTIFEIDILPNRAHDCLSHRGVAREIATLLNIKIATKTLLGDSISKLQKAALKLQISIENETLCRRYVGRIIEHVLVGPSPDWIRKRLLSIGQKPINNVVDATNYVMFHLGQPMHAFDADKLASHDIIVRAARDGERITTLDKKEVMLNDETLVIADKESPLAIAGIKGGMKAEVNELTKNIILESANFELSNIRRTVQKTGIRTDSSKRFEQGIAPELALDAMELATELIVAIAGGKETRVGDAVDIYPRPGAPYKTSVSLEEINSLLGLNLREEDVKHIFERLNFSYEIIDPIKKVLALAPTFLGVPYRHGASVVYDAPREFDCSSFTAYLYAQAGVAIPRMSIDQYVFGREVPQKEMIPGDLVFSYSSSSLARDKSVEYMTGTETPDKISHVGLYIGNDKIIHAACDDVSGEVRVESLSESASFKNFVGARRIYQANERFVVSVPSERLDIRITYDLIEEIGRIHGYGNITEALPNVLAVEEIEERVFYREAIRAFFTEKGFSEVYTYSFVGDDNRGVQVSLENPLALDKPFLRGTLAKSFKEKFETNAYYADLLDIDAVKIFEIGNIFDPKQEREILGVGVKLIKKIKKGPTASDVLLEAVNNLSSALGITKSINTIGIDIETDQSSLRAFLEIPFDIIVAEADKKIAQQQWNEQTLFCRSPDVVYQTLSKYPFVVRDVAFFVPELVSSEEAEHAIREEAGPLLARLYLFDTFLKDGKKSFAFRLIFQSYDKTLSDDEVNVQMNQIYQTIEKRSWAVR